MNLREKSPLWRRVVRALGRKLFRLAENNDDARVVHNGEEWLLRQLLTAHAAGTRRPFVVFDAGANAGDYTRLVLDIAQQVECPIEVHAFEPAPFNVERLRERFGAQPQVVVVPAAVGASPGMTALYAGKSGSTLASLVPREVLGSEMADVTSVPVLRLDEYLAKVGVKRVDFLKLDVEGFELAALRGLGDALGSVNVDVIQFEYGGTTLDAGVTLRQLFEVLTQAGYRIAKLFPAALELRKYHVGLEHYSYANYVALSPTSVPSHPPRG